MKSKEFGAYLKGLRESRKMTLLDVQREAKISNGYLSQIESGVRGIPHFDTLKKLAGVYKVSIADLIKNSELASDGEEIKAEGEVEFLSRGYQQLSPTEKEQLKGLLEYLLHKKNKQGRSSQSK
jgi:transcriptional regulator with XRE-family HTH domain